MRAWKDAEMDCKVETSIEMLLYKASYDLRKMHIVVTVVLILKWTISSWITFISMVAGDERREVGELMS